MAEIYSRLRRKRKRTHPTKCPCCISDSELEPENQVIASTQIDNEKSHDDNTQVKKRKRNTKDNGDNVEDGKTGKNVKISDIKTRSRSSSPSTEGNKKVQKKGSKKKDNSGKNGKKSETNSNNPSRNANNSKTISSKGKRNVKTDKGKVSKTDKKIVRNEEEEEEFESDDEVALSKLRKVVKKKSTNSERTNNSDQNKDDDLKVNNGKPKRKASTSKAKQQSQSRQASVKEQDVFLSNSNNDGKTAKPKDVNTTSKNQGRQSKRSKAKKKPPSEDGGHELLIDEGTYSASKTQDDKEIKSPNLKLKVDVFNHLFKTLKTCMNDRKLAIKDAASILLKMSPEDLSLVIKSGQREQKSSKTCQAEVGNTKQGAKNESHKSLKGTRTMCSDSEETVSQAAEALVSFRSKSPKLREENQREDVTRTVVIPTPVVVTPIKQSQDTSQTFMDKAPNFSSSQAVQALMQIQTNHVTNQPLVNQQPMMAPQVSLPTFTQLTTHLRQSLVSSSSSLANPLLNQGAMTSSAQPQQVLMTSQSLIQPKPQVTSTLSSNQLRVLAGLKQASQTQQPILPQQPLKAMEEVIGNVGSNVSQLMWSSPMVFLGSPQNLGGVPRNLISQGSPVVAPQESSSYHHPVPLKPKKETMSAPASAMPVGGRPILPRTQPPRPFMQDTSTVTSTGYPTSVGPSVPSNIYPAASKTTMYTTMPQPSTPVFTTAPLPSKPAKSPTQRMTFKASTVAAASGDKSTGEGTQGTTASPGFTAKQAVKKLVSERTKSAELKRELKTPDKAQSPDKARSILSYSISRPFPTPTKGTPVTSSSSSASKTSEFNLEQAATTLLSIGGQEGSEGGGPATPCVEEEDMDEKVVFTSKGMFRVGDVDVDPEFNRIGVEGYTCGKCGKIFTSLNYLARHIKRVCPDMSCRKWKCSMCDKAFRHPFGLQQHIYTHTGERPHKCLVCPKAFYSSNDLRRHSRIHSGERPYHCKHCDKNFATTISLKTHTYIHTGEKPHKCPQCPKTFATSSKLGRHIVTHSEQRPYSCEQCPKSFNRSGDLRRHCMTVHDGKEKTYDCNECSVSFTRTGDLRRHLSTVHHASQGKPLPCRECSTTFTTPLCLKMHIDTHHRQPNDQAMAPPTLYKCQRCDKTYDSAVQLEKHQQAHEPSSAAGYDSTQFQAIAPRPSERIVELGTGQ